MTVEKLQPLPRSMGGSAANFARGLSRGFEWMLVALGIPYQLVSPQAWQKVMHAGTSGHDTKQRSVVAAQRLFPGITFQRSERSRRVDDGLCEAALIAEYGRRVRQGGLTGNLDSPTGASATVARDTGAESSPAGQESASEVSGTNRASFGQKARRGFRRLRREK